MRKRKKKKLWKGGSLEMLEMLSKHFKHPHNTKKPTKHRQITTAGSSW